VGSFVNAHKFLYPLPRRSPDHALGGAFLPAADLNTSLLRDADLGGAVLISANLSGANLSRAVLTDADLSDANLANAVVTDEQLDACKSLEGATLPDGSKHD
jgi:uncharacterized protein YjbI with pentapeptide repeats